MGTGHGEKPIYEFGAFRLDPGERLLQRCASWPIGVSPDSTRLACLQQMKGPGSSEGWNVAVVRTDDGSPVGSWPVRLPPYYPRRFRWLPQGLAWQFLRSDGGGFNVWVQLIAGGNATQLTRFSSGTIFNFDASLDGKRLAIQRGSLSHDVCC